MLSVKEVAAKLGVSTDTARALIAQGEFAGAWKLRLLVRVPEESVDKFMAKHALERATAKAG